MAPLAPLSRPHDVHRLELEVDHLHTRDHHLITFQEPINQVETISPCAIRRQMLWILICCNSSSATVARPRAESWLVDWWLKTLSAQIEYVMPWTLKCCLTKEKILWR